MAYFSNRTVNYLNLHVALFNMLDQAFVVFMPIYLYTQGFPVPAILGVIGGSIFLRLPARFLCLPVIERVGLRVGIIIGGVGYALTFPVLAQVHGMDAWLVLYMLMYAFFNSGHWLCLHAYYCFAGDAEKRGRQVAVGAAMTFAFCAIMPVISALVITKDGFGNYLLLPLLSAVGMVWALTHCPDIRLPRLNWRDGMQAFGSLSGRIHFADSGATYPLNICWLFVVYTYVGTIMPLSGIISFGVLVQMAYQLVLGALTDRGRGKIIVHAAGVLRSCVAVGRAFVPLSLPAILGLEMLNSASGVHQSATQPIALYNAGKTSLHPLWYWLFAEMGWDVGTSAGTAIAATLLMAGVELRFVILLSLPFIWLLWRILYLYFARHPRAPIGA